MNPTSLLSGLGAAVTAEPTLGGLNGGGRESGSGTADLFLTLVAGMLDGQGADGEVPSLLGTGAVDTGPASELPVDVAPDAADLTSVPAALPVMPAMLAQALPAVDAPATATPPVGGAESAAVVATSAATAAAAVDVTAVVAAPAGAEAHADAGQAAGPTAGQDARQEAGQDAGQDAGRGAGGDTGTPATATAPSVASPTPATTPAAATTPTAVTAVGAAAPAAPAAPVDSAAAPAAPRVAEQVFPEVVRISGGTVEGGPRRVTVKLNPESLGEVRIVLTQRRGELEVALTAGQDARRALAEGASELHRLLEAVGRTDSRIVFRELPGTSTLPAITPDGAPRTDVSTDLSGDAWSGAGRPGGEPAADRDGTRQFAGRTNATDGTASATPESRPVTTAGRSHRGVDLTM